MAGSVHKSHVLTSQLGGYNSSYRPTAAADAGSHHGSTLEEHRRFAAAIRAGTAPDVSADDGYLAVAMGLAAQQSIAEVRPVWMAELLG